MDYDPIEYCLERISKGLPVSYEDRVKARRFLEQEEQKCRSSVETGRAVSLLKAQIWQAAFFVACIIVVCSPVARDLMREHRYLIGIPLMVFTWGGIIRAVVEMVKSKG